MPKVIKAIQKYSSVIFVILVSIIASVFVSCAKRIEDNKNKTKSPGEGQLKESSDVKSVDVNETKQGQPIRRNLLE